MKSTVSQCDDSVVQIFIPCFNAEKTLPMTLSSILAQTTENYNVTLVDNASSDQSTSLITALNDQRFSVIRFEENVSLGANFNRCIDRASAKYFCIMHADDEYEPNYLKNMIYALDSYPSVTMAFCNANIIDEDSSRRFSLKNQIKKRASKLKTQRYVGEKGVLWISDYNKVIAPSVMFRTSARRFFESYRNDLKFTLDWDLYFRILQNGGELLHVNETLFNYRVHKNQQTAALIASMEKYYEMRTILDRIYSELDNVSLSLRSRKYCSLSLTIFMDAFKDLYSFRFNHAKQKIRYLKTIL